MVRRPNLTVGIVDYGMGNLFSVQMACEHAGLQTMIASTPQDVSAAAAVVIPGVGAFGDAISMLQQLDLITPLIEFAASGKPLLGICLGMQLLMTESQEFGLHRGLGIIEGDVVSLNEQRDGRIDFKVPQVGWNTIRFPESPRNPTAGDQIGSSWHAPLLEGIPEYEYMYFVHSFYAKPLNDDVVTSLTAYGPVEFCSSVQSGNVFGCQFHPERSGPAGLMIYKNLASLLEKQGDSANRA